MVPRYAYPGFFLALLMGCTSTARVEVPAFDAEAAAAAAMKQYDTNGDGQLDAKELEKCPALKNALKQLDTTGDGRISREELLVRLRQFEDSNVGLYVTTVRVQLDGKPLAGAQVRLEPERFMGPTIKAAEATTDDSGRASLRIKGSELPGCNFGFYRVHVSKKDDTGRELVPARYEDSLGAEVPSRALVFSLSSK